MGRSSICPVLENPLKLEWNARQLETLYKFYLSLNTDPRIPINRFHNEVNLYRRRSTTEKLIREAFEYAVINGPILYCNNGIEVDFFDDVSNPQKMLEKVKKDKRTLSAFALSGDWDFIWFRRGASLLNYIDAVQPSFKSSIRLEEIFFDQKGEILEDPYPHGWDEMDWRVYHAMRLPRTRTYVEFGKSLNISWKTVSKRFQRLLSQCKIVTSFFPNSVFGYNYLVVTFNTKYEVGLVRELQKLDRSSYVYKIEDTIMLGLFLSLHPLSINKVSERFRELQEIGIVHNLAVSIPSRWYNTIENSP